ncbi:MAG: hypothetical protein D6731_09240 [Planctomycetota bacterium]|nr:MAG: hypothetical protein D6731_09240 [Planctomycetota bacterium]
MTSCPFLELCERDLEGPALSEEEQRGLEDHLSAGCPSCEERIEAYVSGSGGGEAAAVMRELDGRLARASEFAAEAMASSEARVLARVRERVRGEAVAERRRERRRAQRLFFYVLNLLAVVLMAAAYAGTYMAARVQQRAAQRIAALNELNALAIALARYVREHPGRVPADAAELVEALAGPRAEGAQPYYPFEADRLRGCDYLDPFGRPYRFLGRGSSGGVLYSVGPDGRDERGGGDDLARPIIFAHRSP